MWIVLGLWGLACATVASMLGFITEYIFLVLCVGVVCMIQTIDQIGAYQFEKSKEHFVLFQTYYATAECPTKFPHAFYFNALKSHQSQIRFERYLFDLYAADYADWRAKTGFERLRSPWQKSFFEYEAYLIHVRDP